MFALVKEDSIKLFTPHTIWEDKNGTQHSPETLIGMTSQQKQDAGIYDVAYAARGDDRFYSIVENEPVFDEGDKIVKITYTQTPKDLEDSGEGDALSKGLKSQWISSTKAYANTILSSTDWMLVRKIERDIDVPSATATYRAAVIAEANRLETAISAVAGVEELISVVNSANWPVAE